MLLCTPELPMHRRVEVHVGLLLDVLTREGTQCARSNSTCTALGLAVSKAYAAGLSRALLLAIC